MAKAPIVVKKSYQDGLVAVGIHLACRGWNGGSAKIEASTDLTIDQARALAQLLIQEADRVDAKAKAKAEAAERRAKWRAREVAAGRMVILGGRP